jgi:hypothetical protein
VKKLEDAHLRWQIQHATDAELLSVMTEEQRAEWEAAGVSDAEIVRRVKTVLKDWGYW